MSDMAGERGKRGKRGKRVILHICCKDVNTYIAFKKYAVGFKNYEEALKSLLEKAGVLTDLTFIF